MSVFSYRAIDHEGVLKRGAIEADALNVAYDDLALQGLNVINITEASKFSSSLTKNFFGKKVKRRDIVEFANNLSVIMRAGIPLLDALDDISQSTENKHLKFALDDIRDRIRMGIGFSEALAFHKDVFPDILVRLVTVGEETGRLEQSVQEVSDHLQRMEELAAMMSRAFIYPVILLVLACGMMIFWFSYVLPAVVSLLKDLQVELPPVTRLLIALTDLLKVYWYVVPIVLIVLIISFQIFSRKESMRYHYDYLKLKLPLIKLFVKNRLLATLAEQLRILIISGITIDRSLSIVSVAVGSEVFKRALVKAKEEIMTGSRIAEAFKKHDVFPRLVIRMVDIGESSGSLDHQFEFLSNYYYKQLEDVTAKFGKIIEPALIVIVGIIYAIVLAAVFLPIYGGIQTIR